MSSPIFVYDFRFEMAAKQLASSQSNARSRVQMLGRGRCMCATDHNVSAPMVSVADHNSWDHPKQFSVMRYDTVMARLNSERNETAQGGAELNQGQIHLPGLFDP